MATDKNKDINSNQQGNQNWDEQNDQRSGSSREPNPERFEKEDTQLGQESNQDWDEENDKRSGNTHKPNPERFESGGSGFNEKQQTAATPGSSQRGQDEKVSPTDAGLNDLPSEKRLGKNQTGPGLG